MIRGLAFAVLLLPVVVRAHPLDSATLALRETSPGVFDVRWRTSVVRLPGVDIHPTLPARCRHVGATDRVEDRDYAALRWTVDCGASGLAGEVIGATDLDLGKVNALVTVERLNGEKTQAMIGPRTPSFAIPAQPTRWGVVRGYVALGIEHILGGPDHLLFVFGLLLLVSTTRLLVQTITAFTLGHSITLSAAALGLAHVPSRPVEVLIAVSVLTLAVELARDGDQPTMLRRFPWAMAVAFGLLHGFGFAGALAEAGLPAGDIPLALVSFNVGIEVGQLTFVAVVLGAGALLARWVPGAAASFRWLAVNAMGMLAAFWCFERAAVWLG